MSKVQSSLLGLLQDTEADLDDLQRDIGRGLWEDEPSLEMEELETAARNLRSAVRAFRIEADARAEIAYFERHGGNEEHRMSVREFL